MFYCVQVPAVPIFTLGPTDALTAVTKGTMKSRQPVQAFRIVPLLVVSQFASIDSVLTEFLQPRTREKAWFGILQGCVRV